MNADDSDVIRAAHGAYLPARLEPRRTSRLHGIEYFGEDWFGHNADLTISSVLLRFNPRIGVAIVVAAAADNAFGVLAGLFGPALPEFTELRIPRPLRQSELEMLERRAYLGKVRPGRTSDRALPLAIGQAVVHHFAAMPHNPAIYGSRCGLRKTRSSSVSPRTVRNLPLSICAPVSFRDVRVHQEWQAAVAARVIARRDPADHPLMASAIDVRAARTAGKTPANSPMRQAVTIPEAMTGKLTLNA